MNYYSADSVIAELKANNTLICEGIEEIGCPSPAPSSSTHENRICKKDASVCNECNSQVCNQWIIVRSDKYLKLAALFFSFFFSTHPRGGRIRKDDSLLSLLIRRKLINENKLEIC